MQSSFQLVESVWECVLILLCTYLELGQKYGIDARSAIERPDSKRLANSRTPSLSVSWVVALKSYKAGQAQKSN